MKRPHHILLHQSSQRTFRSQQETSMHRSILALAFGVMSLTAAYADESPMLEIVWPPAGAVIELGSNDGQTIGVVVKSNFALVQAGLCGDNHACGHIHMKIDPEG